MGQRFVDFDSQDCAAFGKVQLALFIGQFHVAAERPFRFHQHIRLKGLQTVILLLEFTSDYAWRSILRRNQFVQGLGLSIGIPEIMLLVAGVRVACNGG